MSLQHELRRTRSRVPELHTPVLGTRQYPVGLGGESNRQNKIAVALEGFDTLATLRTRLVSLTRGAELPHFDSPIETARN